MKRFALLAVLAACVDAAAPATSDLDMAADDHIVSAAKLDAPGWETAPTLHEGTHLVDRASAQSRRVHSLWIAGSNMNHVPLVVHARAMDDQNVRIAVLGPIANGERPVLGADGYSAAKRDATVTLDISQPGEHLVVIGSYDLATDTTYDVSVTCPGPDGCGVSRYDVFATPKDGALVGDESRVVSMLLGDALTGHDFDVNVELWASPPNQPWNATKLATSTASGMQVNAIIPASVANGDDLRLVAKTPDGRTLDSGITTRFSATHSAFARLDAITYGDTGSVEIPGVVGFFEGQADLRLVSETRKMELAEASVHVDRPGQEGNGLNAFDATFAPSGANAAHDGEILSVGYLDGNGDYRRLGCFEYCNNLSGLSSCTGGARACP